MRVGRITRIEDSGKVFYWEIIRFKKLRDLKRWAARHRLPKCSSREATTIEWLNAGNLLGTLLISDEKCDANVLAHEAVHMARQLTAKMHTRRDEESLAYAVGDITETLLEMLSE